MTAYELADQVEMWGKDLLALNMKGGIPVIEGAKMLRQQQAEINRLKTLCILYIDDEWSGTSSYQAKIDEVNNERK
jgi:hypothetical protein